MKDSKAQPETVNGYGLSACYTPGPWSVTRPFVDDSGETIIQIESPECMVAEVYAGETPEGISNANILAASKDLADCLRNLHDLQNGCPLPKYQQAWENTMNEAITLLKRLGV